MAVIFFDPFDGRTTLTQMGWSTVTDYNNPSISAGNGRFGGNSLRCTQNAQARHPIVGFPATIVSMFSFRDSVFNGATIIFRLIDNITSQVIIYRRSDGKIEAKRGDGTSLGISSLTIDANIYYHIDVKILISDTVGTVLVKVDNVTYLNITGADTKNTANAYVTAFAMGDDSNNSSNRDWSDFVLLDTTGAAPFNDVIGDIRLITDAPSAAGTDAAFTPLAGLNYQNIDEIPPDEDTTYNEDSTVNDKDNFTFPNLPVGVLTAYGVGTIIRARRTNTNPRSIASQTLLAGVYDTSADIVLSTDYNTISTFHPLDPSAVAWTPANVNSAKVGYKLTA